MNHWIAAFLGALVVIVGQATGPVALVIALVVFLIALYLLWAYELGYKGAWAKFGLSRFSPPLWKVENRKLLWSIFDDCTKVIKASAVAVGLVVIWLLLPPILVRIFVVLLIGWCIVEIHKTRKLADQADSARFS
jgi:hypothetical protein